MQAVLVQSTPATQSAPSTTESLPVPAKRRWGGAVLSGLPVLFLLFDGAIKLVNIPAVAEASARLGYPADTMRPLGLLLLACTLLYAARRTAVLGAVLLTGYLGGAIATHVRVGDPLASHTLFPVYIAAMLWGGLYLRDERVRALAPWRKAAPRA